MNLHHLLHSIPLEVYFVSQLKRCFNVSLNELILSCPIFHKINYCEVSFVVTVLDKDLKRKGFKINMMLAINIYMKGTWIMKIVLVSVPSDFLPYA